MDHINLIDLPSKIFVTGIGTGVGKTVASASLCKYYGYSYWKPIQSGDLDNSDSDVIRKSNPGIFIYPEQFRLNTPMSPHASAAIDGVYIYPQDFHLPDADKLCVEGAGGIMVPINEEQTMLDLVKHLDIPVVLVIRDYLGCINHSLLSLMALQQNQIEVAAIIFNGAFTASTLAYLQNKTESMPAIYLPELEEN